MVRFIFSLLLLMPLMGFGQGQDFYAELQYQHRNTDSLNLVQKNLLPEKAFIYAKDSIVVQVIEMPFGTMIRREILGRDSIENYVSFLTNRMLIMSAVSSFKDPVSTQKTKKTKRFNDFDLSVAIGKFKGKEFPIYYVETRASGLFSRFENIAGIPLQYKLGPLEKGMETLVFIKHISKELPKDFNFDAPSGYERVSKDQLNTFASFFK